MKKQIASTLAILGLLGTGATQVANAQYADAQNQGAPVLEMVARPESRVMTGVPAGIYSVSGPRAVFVNPTGTAQITFPGVMPGHVTRIGNNVNGRAPIQFVRNNVTFRGWLPVGNLTPVPAGW